MTERDGEATVGPLEVETDAASVGRFRASLGYPNTTTFLIPHTFPVCWLTRAELRTGVQRLLSMPRLLIHARQSVSYRKPLALNTRYHLTARLLRQGKILQLTATVAALDGTQIVDLESELLAGLAEHA